MRPMARWEKVIRGLRYAFLLPDRSGEVATAPDAIRFPERNETLDPA